MAKNKLHIEPSDVMVATCSDGWGGFDYSCLVERINTEKVWKKCLLLDDVLFEEHHVFCDIQEFDYLGYLSLLIHPGTVKFTDDELAIWVADAINKVISEK